MQVDFTLTGEMPLLMHRDDVEAADRLNEWRKHPDNKNQSVSGDDRSPPWTWQTYLYSDGEHVCMPAENIMVALRQAGAQIILKKQKTYKEITQSGLLICSEFCKFLVDGKQIPIKKITSASDKPFPEQSKIAESLGFRLFVKRATIGQKKHVRVRPRFESWSVTGSLDILTADITFETLKDLFVRAGRVGLCDWRPGCKTPGPYGMFKSELKKA